MYRQTSRRRLRRLARRTEYDFAYERYALFQDLGSVVRRRTSAFWVLEVNALLALEATTERRATSSRRLALAAERRTLRAADRIVAVTAALSEQIQRVHGVDRDRIIVIENGVDGARSSVSGRSSDSAGTRIGFLGTIYRWQSVDRLIRALDDPRVPSDVTVHIAGGGPELGRLEEQVRASRMEGRVEFLGRIHPDAVPEFLAEVDVCYAGHVSENGAYFSPLKLWEYLAAAKPVIATRHDATERLEASGYAVRCFDGSDQGLASVLMQTVASKDELRSVAEQRRDAVLREHSWEARIHPLLETIAKEGNQ
jgi:glycosyltransferase involved in cell wall biosynthesis